MGAVLTGCALYGYKKPAAQIQRHGILRQIPAIKVKFPEPDKVSSSHSLSITEKIHWVFGDIDSISKKKWPVKKFGYCKHIVTSVLYHSLIPKCSPFQRLSGIARLRIPG
jgi:hypothetical protein